MTTYTSIASCAANKIYLSAKKIGIFSISAMFSLFSVLPSGAVSLKKTAVGEAVTIISALSLDKKQTVKVKAAIISEEGAYGIMEIDGWAEGHKDNSINGTVNVWLSMGHKGMEAGIYEEDVLPGWNIMIMLRPGQSPEQTAKAIAEHINSDNGRPYYAVAHCHKVLIYYRSAYNNKSEDDIKQDCERSSSKLRATAKIIRVSDRKNTLMAKMQNKTEVKKENAASKNQDFHRQRICVFPMD